MISKIIDEILKNILKQVENNNLLDDLTERRNFQGIELSGNSFQVATVFNTLSEANKYLNDDRIDRICAYLKNIIVNNYRLNGFNYFQQFGLPDDLDTASSMALAISTEECNKTFLSRVNSNSNKDGSINTWFLNDSKYDEERFNNTSIVKNNLLVQSDVMFNYFLTISSNISNSNKISLVDVINNYGINSFWYLPKNYSLYQLLLLANRSFNVNNKEIIVGELKKCNFQTKNICSFEQIQNFIINNPYSWFSELLSIGCDYEYCILLNKKIDFDRYSRVIRQLNQNLTSKCPIYWTVGLEIYSSNIIPLAYLLFIISKIQSHERG